MRGKYRGNYRRINFRIAINGIVLFAFSSRFLVLRSGKSVTRAITTGHPYEFPARFKRADGVYRWLQDRGSPLRDRNGDIVRWYLLITDIDDQKRAEEALRESEHESRLIVDSIPGMIATRAWDGSIQISPLISVSTCVSRFGGENLGFGLNA